MKGPIALAAIISAIVIATSHGAPQKREVCHYNARHQLVCRWCWIERGKYRCGQPRIYKGVIT